MTFREKLPYLILISFYAFGLTALGALSVIGWWVNQDQAWAWGLTAGLAFTGSALAWLSIGRIIGEEGK